ncbi:MAG TPA: HAMP domain-containing sensor histidine kinase [Sediminibacterium sp.]|nr:HAMP domain-containing sensor histidine kinase [Sediminibacterium sp.]
MAASGIIALLSLYHQMFMHQNRVSRILPLSVILLITAFQVYWLTRLYGDEKATLEKETNAIFRDVVYNLQVQRFRNDTLFMKQPAGNNLFIYNAVNTIRREIADQPAAALGDAIEWKHAMTAAAPGDLRGIQIIRTDSANNLHFPDTGFFQKNQGKGVKMVINFGEPDSPVIRQAFKRSSHSAAPVLLDSHVIRRLEKKLPAQTAFIRLLTSAKPLSDTLPLLKLDSAYRNELSRVNISLHFALFRGKSDSVHLRDTLSAGYFRTTLQTVGLKQDYWYQAAFDNPFWFLLGKIIPQLVISVLLVGFVAVSVMFLYRNMLAQQRLTAMKNDFISNITHELKTPLATVGVAVEALRNFGGLSDPARTREYLDISAAEVQRLNLLVDKVLKLSLFENRELDMQMEQLDLAELVREILQTMKLQLDPVKARLSFTTNGSYFYVRADRLHLVSVIYNLLDNAIKYSNGEPDIQVRIDRTDEKIVLTVCDKGIGIPAAYQDKIFDKFFRVPAGDRHNTKGYGLGLSYVLHVVQKHGGSIRVESEAGKGSCFTIQFPIA